MTTNSSNGCNLKEITLDGVKYVRADSVQAQAPNPGKRAVLVLDRGWVVAGDLTRENGRIRVTRALHVVRWEQVGFDGVIANPKSSKVTIKPLPNGFDVPDDAELFCVPVDDAWGL